MLFYWCNKSLIFKNKSNIKFDHLYLIENVLMGNTWNKIIPYSCDVFLGGSCNPTTWRKDIAIPFLTRHNMSYYNPQVEEWHDGLIAIEKKAKKDANVLLFVIDNITRGYASIAEAAYYVGRGRKVVLVIQKVSEANNIISEAEIKDINRGRIYLTDIANEHNIRVFNSIETALTFIVTYAK